MRRTMLGALVGVGLVMAAVAAAEQRGDSFAPRGTPATALPAAGSELVVVPTSLGDRGQMLTVVDPRQRVLCVYHIDLATGKIALKSVRNIQWDLQINDLNNEKPLPQKFAPNWNNDNASEIAMAQKYYNSAETAKLLGKTVEEVKKMLEHRELHGYRDGADWKFKVEDIDRLAKSAPQPPAAEEEGGDVLLSEVAMGQSDPGLSGTVIGMSGVSPIVTDSDIRLAESDIQLGAEAKTPIPKKGDSSAKGTKFEELDLTLGDDLNIEDSKVAIDAKPAAGGSSAIELGGKESDDELVLGGSSSVGSDVTIGGDSGISLVDPSDSGLSLETPINLGAVSDGSIKLGGSDLMAGSGVGVEGASSAIKADDDFLLTPLEEVADTESSESGSQVIALEPEGEDAAAIGAASGISMAAMLDEGLSAQPLELGSAGPLAGSPVLGGQPVALAEGAPLVQPGALYESSYTGLQIAGLAACTVVLMLCGMMMYDLLRNQWSWQGAYPVNSGLMDTILGWLGM